VQQVWEVYKDKGSQDAFDFGLTLNLAVSTLKQWTRAWAKEDDDARRFIPDDGVCRFIPDNSNRAHSQNGRFLPTPGSKNGELVAHRKKTAARVAPPSARNTWPPELKEVVSILSVCLKNSILRALTAGGGDRKIARLPCRSGGLLARECVCPPGEYPRFSRNVF
jgi:hypothetical protein